MDWVGSEFPERFDMRDSISKCAVIGTLVVACLSAPLLAHHSVAAEYDSSKPVTITGAVTEARLLNPHGWLSVDVKGTDGKTVTWQVEMAGTNRLLTIGFRKDTIAVPSSVTIQAWPARDGSMHATGRIPTLADGKQFDVHDAFGENLQTK